MLQVLFLLGPAAVSCLLAVLGYGYTHLNTDNAMDFLQRLYKIHFLDKDQILKDWTKGFQLVMYSVPVWTAIAATMGRMCGRGRKIRNMSVPYYHCCQGGKGGVGGWGCKSMK